MKLRKLTVLSVTLLAILLTGAAATTTILMPAQALVAEQVKFEPKPFDLENPDTVTVRVKLFVEGESVVDQIDPYTVLLEDSIAPINTWTIAPPPNFYAQFDGQTVAGLVISKMIHMGIIRPHPWNPIKVALKITGELYDDTPWEGIGYIKVYIGNPGPLPPPP